MTDFEYDPDLPYVLVAEGEEDEGRVIARFAEKRDAEHSTRQSFLGRVVDTTPKPRVPEDARFITWWSKLHLQQYMARRMAPDRWHIPEVYDGSFKNLPGVTPDTVFTVLEERKNDD